MVAHKPQVEERWSLETVAGDVGTILRRTAGFASSNTSPMATLRRVGRPWSR
jgi:hypothetical protein